MTVGLRPVGDGREVGFDVLDSLPFGPEAVAGFPAVRATVAYSGAGYRATMAWIQVLTIDRFPASAPPSRWTGVDLPPALDGLGLPFYCTGTSPTFFDAPALNLSGASRLHWVADASSSPFRCAPAASPSSRSRASAGATTSLTTAARRSSTR